MYKEIFTNADYQKEFDKKGYVKIQLLSDSAVKKLLSFYESKVELHNSCKNFFRSTSDSNNSELIRETDEIIRSVFINEASHLFKNLDVFLCNFLIKESGLNTETPPHQDVTFVDESKHFSVGIWSPLQDVGYKEGNLLFVNNSHNFMNTLRVNPHYPWAYDNVSHLIKKCSVPVPLKAGEAVVFNHAIIHWAKANISKKTRVSIVVGAQSSGSELYHYFMEDMNSNNKIELFKMDRNSLIDLKKDLRPENAPLLNIISYNFPRITKKEFKKKVLETKSGLNFFRQWLAFKLTF
jgi:hypothetical protein